MDRWKCFKSIVQIICIEVVFDQMGVGIYIALVCIVFVPIGTR